MTGREKAWKKERNHSARSFRFHLKMLKYYVSKKIWWMSITLSLCMRPRTAFAPSVVLQEGHEYLKSLGNGRAYWYPSPYNSCGTVAKSVSLTKSLTIYHYYLSWVPSEVRKNMVPATEKAIQEATLNSNRFPPTKPVHNISFKIDLLNGLLLIQIYCMALKDRQYCAQLLTFTVTFKVQHGYFVFIF